MENNKSQGNSKEFQAEEIDKRFEMDSVNPLPVDPSQQSHALNDALPGPIQPTIIVVPPPQSSNW